MARAVILFFQRVQVPEVRGDLLPGEREPPVLQEAAQVLPPSSSDSGRSAGESLSVFYIYFYCVCIHLSNLKSKTPTLVLKQKVLFTFLQLQNFAFRLHKIFIDVNFRKSF